MWQNVLCYTKRREISCVHQSAEKKTHVELGCWVTWTIIIALTKIGASIGIPPVLGNTQVASYLGLCLTTGGEFKELTVRRGIVQVTVLIRRATVGIWDPHDMVE